MCSSTPAHTATALVSLPPPEREDRQASVRSLYGQQSLRRPGQSPRVRQVAAGRSGDAARAPSPPVAPDAPIGDEPAGAGDAASAPAARNQPTRRTATTDGTVHLARLSEALRGGDNKLLGHPDEAGRSFDFSAGGAAPRGPRARSAVQLRAASPSLRNEYTPRDPSLFLASPRNVASPNAEGRVEPFKRISKQEGTSLWRLPQCVADDNKARAAVLSLNSEDPAQRVSSARRGRAQSALHLRTLPSADLAIEDAVHLMAWPPDAAPIPTDLKALYTQRRGESDAVGSARANPATSLMDMYALDTRLQDRSAAVGSTRAANRDDPDTVHTQRRGGSDAVGFARGANPAPSLTDLTSPYTRRRDEADAHTDWPVPFAALDQRLKLQPGGKDPPETRQHDGFDGAGSARAAHREDFNTATGAASPGAMLMAHAQVALSRPAADRQAAALPATGRVHPPTTEMEATFARERGPTDEGDARSPPGSRPASSQPGGARPGSSQPTSLRPTSSRPTSLRPADSRLASSRSGCSRPVSHKSSRPGSPRGQPWSRPQSSEIDMRPPANKYEVMRELLRQNRWIRQELERHGVVRATDNDFANESGNLRKEEEERKPTPIAPSSISNPSILIEQQLRMLRASGPVADEPPWALGDSRPMSAANRVMFPPSLRRAGSSMSEMELPNEEAIVQIDTAARGDDAARPTPEGEGEAAVEEVDTAAAAPASGEAAAVAEEVKPPDLNDQLPGLAKSFCWVRPAANATKEGEDDTPPLGLLERAPSVASVASAGSKGEATPRSVRHFMEHFAAEDAAALNEAAITLRGQMQQARAEANAKEAELRQLSDLHKGLLVNANANPNRVAAPPDVREQVVRRKELEHMLRESEEACAQAEDMHATLEHMLNRAKEENPERERDVLLMRLGMVETDQIIDTLRERHQFAVETCRKARVEVKHMQLAVSRQRTEHFERKSEMHARVRERERARAELVSFGAGGQRQASSVGGLRRLTGDADSKPGASAPAPRFRVKARKVMSVEMLWERLCALTGVSSTQELIQFWNDSLRAKATLAEAEQTRKVNLEALQREAKYHSTYLASLQRIAQEDDTTIAIDKHWKEVEMEANLKERAMHATARRLSEIESVCEGAIAQLTGISAKLQKKWLLDKAPSILRHLVQKSQARLDTLSDQIKELAAPRDQASLAAAVRKAQFNAEAAASTAEKLQANKGELSTDGAATAAMGEVAAAAASIAASATSDGRTVADAGGNGMKLDERISERAGGGGLTADAADGATGKAKESKSKAKNKPMDNIELAQEMIAETQALWSAQLCTNVEKLMAVLFDIWRAPVMDKATARPDHPVHLQSELCVALNVRTKPPQENDQQLGMSGDEEDTSAWDPASAVDLSSRRASFKPGASPHPAPDSKREERSGEGRQSGENTANASDVLTREDIKRRAQSQMQHVTAESVKHESDPVVTPNSPGESRPRIESVIAKAARMASAKLLPVGGEEGTAAVGEPESNPEAAQPSKARRRRVSFDEPTDAETKTRTARRKGPAQPFVFDDKD